MLKQNCTVPKKLTKAVNSTLCGYIKGICTLFEKVLWEKEKCVSLGNVDY